MKIQLHYALDNGSIKPLGSPVDLSEGDHVAIYVDGKLTDYYTLRGNDLVLTQPNDIASKGVVTCR